MNRKFTSASANDKEKVTVTLRQFDDCVESDCVPRSCLIIGRQLIISIKVKRKTIDVVFAVNRTAKGLYEDVGVTAATLSWPRQLRLPKVGKPVIYNVVGVRYV